MSKMGKKEGEEKQMNKHGTRRENKARWEQWRKVADVVIEQVNLGGNQEGAEREFSF